MTEAIIVAIVAATPGALVALGALIQGRANGRKADELHISLNSRLTELLKVTAAASHAEGLAMGREGTGAEAQEAREVIQRAADAAAMVKREERGGG